MVRKGRAFYATLYQEVFFGKTGGGGSLSFAVHKLAKFSANLGKVHFEGLVHLHCTYYFGTITLYVRYYYTMAAHNYKSYVQCKRTKIEIAEKCRSKY